MNEGEIRLLDMSGKSHTIYSNLCSCNRRNCDKHICELNSGQYLADLCYNCNEIKVVNMVTHEIHKAYSGNDVCKLTAMCPGAGEGKLLIWDHNSQAVIKLQWYESTRKLDEVSRVQVPVGSDWVEFMCYIPEADLVILRRRYYQSYVVQAVNMGKSASQHPGWKVEGQVLGRMIGPVGMSRDRGKILIADWNIDTGSCSSRLLLLNSYTGEPIQQLLKDAGKDPVLYRAFFKVFEWRYGELLRYPACWETSHRSADFIIDQANHVYRLD